MRNTTKADLPLVIQELIDNCEGAIMASSADDYVNYFCASMKDKLVVLKMDVDDAEIKDVK